MRVYIANFGRENYEWPVCKERGTIATMNAADAQPLWEAGDRDAYIEHRMKSKTWAGRTPTRPLASRWYNLMTIVSATAGDMWLHREGEFFWWTISRPDPAIFERKIEPVGDRSEVVICHKPCEPWSNTDRKGNHLRWDYLHRKAKDFLSTEATLQQLGEDNAAYAQALISAHSLEPWHQRPEWVASNDKAMKSGKGYGAPRSLTDRQIAAARMASQAVQTTSTSNGQETTTVVKNKEFGFGNKYELEQYILSLIEAQGGLCMLTDLKLEYREDCQDKELLASLDRIDSDGHYAPGNLQVVCRFANRWKSASQNEEFRRLIGVVRSL